MTDPQLLQTTCTRGIQGAQFTGGVQIFPVSIGPPYAWLPAKSYFLIKGTLKNAAGTAPLTPSQLTTFADNLPGGLWDNIYIQGGGGNVSKCQTYVAQCSALDKRINSGYSRIKSIGNVCQQEASFQKRLLASTSNVPSANNVVAAYAANASSTGIGAYDDREVYKPYAGAVANTTPQNFATSTVQITAAAPTVVLGVGTDFKQGMPLGSAPVGGSVLPGDLIVIITDDTHLTISAAAAVVVTLGGDTVASVDWFIVRADVIRTPQTANSIEVVWQPPLGFMKSTEYMGAGNWQIVMSPNANFVRNVVETKDPNWSSANPIYSFNVDEVFFYYHVEKMAIPEGPRNLFFIEYAADSKQANSNLSFEVASSTTALTVFVQDNLAGNSPLAPPSMFKVLDNSDLGLTSIQVQYAGITKTSTPWLSNYQGAIGAAAPANNYINQLQQRYYDSFNESGMDPNAYGCESFSDWLKRGPFYHFAFDRDMNNRATTVQINLTFSGNVPNARVFLIAHKRVTCQMVTTAGAIVSATTADA